MPDYLCLIPARAGSTRIPNKNFRELGGKPLISWTIDAARDSGVFDRLIIATDMDLSCPDQEWSLSGVTADGAITLEGSKPDPLFQLDRRFSFPPDLLFRRPPVPNDQPDIEWVTSVLTDERVKADPKDTVVLLRPTSPFRDPETIRRALKLWEEIGGTPEQETYPAALQKGFCGLCDIGEGWRHKPTEGYDSMRAIRRATEPAYKQWRAPNLEPFATYQGVPIRVDSDLLTPGDYEIEPITSLAAKKHLHSRPTQTFEQCWIQTGAIEIFWAQTIYDTGTIAGRRVAGFVMEGAEGLDINTEEDWEEAEAWASAMSASSSSPDPQHGGSSAALSAGDGSTP